MPVSYLKETPSQTGGPYVHIGTMPSWAGLNLRTQEKPWVMTTAALPVALLIFQPYLPPSFQVWAPVVSLPGVETPSPALTVPPLFTVTNPLIDPVPARVPELFTLTAPVPVAEPVAFWARSRPPSIDVPPV